MKVFEARLTTSQWELLVKFADLCLISRSALSLLYATEQYSSACRAYRALACGNSILMSASGWREKNKYFQLPETRTVLQGALSNTEGW